MYMYTVNIHPTSYITHSYQGPNHHGQAAFLNYLTLYMCIIDFTSYICLFIDYILVYNVCLVVIDFRVSFDLSYLNLYFIYFYFVGTWGCGKLGQKYRNRYEDDIKCSGVCI